MSIFLCPYAYLLDYLLLYIYHSIKLPFYLSIDLSDYTTLRRNKLITFTLRTYMNYDLKKKKNFFDSGDKLVAARILSAFHQNPLFNTVFYPLKNPHLPKRIRWDPRKYGGQSLIHPLPKAVWRPRVFLINTLEDRDPFGDDIRLGT